MQYIFGLLLVANIGLLGYFATLHKPKNVAFEKAKAEITTPVSFTNTSKYAPPVIGNK